MVIRQATTYGFLRDKEEVYIEATENPSHHRSLFVNTERVPDIRVRQAISYALDRELIVEAAYSGMGTPALATPIPPSMFGHEEDVLEYSYNPALARALLEEAGYGPDELSLVIVTRSSDATWVQAAAGYLNDVGIQTEVEIYESGAFSALRKTSDYDILVQGVGRAAPFQMLPYFHSDNIPYPNMSRYAGVDGLIDGYLASVAEAAQKEALSQIQDRLAVDLPVIYVIYAKMPTAARADLKGLTPNTHYYLYYFYPMYYED